MNGIDKKYESIPFEITFKAFCEGRDEFSYRNYKKDKDSENKINESLNRCFYILTNIWFGEGKTNANG